MPYAAAELIEACGYPVERLPQRAQLLILSRTLPFGQCGAHIFKEAISGVFALGGVEIVIYFYLILSEVLISPECYWRAAWVCCVLVSVSGIVDVVYILVSRVTSHRRRAREASIVLHESQRTVILHLVLVLLGPELLYPLGILLDLGLDRRSRRAGARPAHLVDTDEVGLLLQAAVLILESLGLRRCRVGSLHAPAEDIPIPLDPRAVLVLHAVDVLHNAVVVGYHPFIAGIELVIGGCILRGFHSSLEILEPIFSVGDAAAQFCELFFIALKLTAPRFQSQLCVPGAAPAVRGLYRLDTPAIGKFAENVLNTFPPAAWRGEAGKQIFCAFFGL